jgi:prophage regulatory protein
MTGRAILRMLWAGEELHEMLLRLPQVMREVALCRSSIYAAISEGRFPPPLRISRRAVAWRVEDIEAWKAQLVQGGPVRWGQLIEDASL